MLVGDIGVDVELYRVRHKNNPLDLWAVFLATAGNSNAKFYTLIYSSRTCRHQQH